ncbi:hypothetical protein [Tunicatimonas pelagia]|uniref:hypothetical protein n=1 Tax=Tunicatimonas pelagia TaxID=931531 RepID=UPI0026656636|nr:hypothetical protein [Tunicatimonas pelagia]WKN46506.1 hypothetical protein P0M28_30615 [Tunicatimonas pelagia]
MAKSIQLIDYLNKIPVYQLDPFVELIQSKIEIYGVNPYRSVLYDLVIRYNRIKTVQSKNIIENLASQYYKYPVEIDSVSEIVLKDTDFIGVYDKNISVLSGELIFSPVAEHFDNLNISESTDLLGLIEKAFDLSPCSSQRDDFDINSNPDRSPLSIREVVNTSAKNKMNSEEYSQRESALCKIIENLNAGFGRGGTCLLAALSKYNNTNNDLHKAVRELEDSFSCILANNTGQNTYPSELEKKSDIQWKVDLKKNGGVSISGTFDECDFYCSDSEILYDGEGTPVGEISTTTYGDYYPGTSIRHVYEKTNNRTGESTEVILHENGDFYYRETYADGSKYVEVRKINEKTGAVKHYQGQFDSTGRLTYAREKVGKNKYKVYAIVEVDGEEETWSWYEDEEGNPIPAPQTSDADENNPAENDNIPEESPRPDPFSSSENCRPSSLPNDEPFGRFRDFTMPTPDYSGEDRGYSELLNDINECLAPSDAITNQASCDLLIRCPYDNCDCALTGSLTDLDNSFYSNCDELIRCPEGSFLNSECNCVEYGLVGGFELRRDNLSIPAIEKFSVNGQNQFNFSFIQNRFESIQDSLLIRVE